MVLGIEHRDIGVGQGDGVEGHQPRAVDDIHLLTEDELTRELVIGRRSYRQPETRGFGLSERTCSAPLAAKTLDLVVVSGPFLAVECRRRARPKLG